MAFTLSNALTLINLSARGNLKALRDVLGDLLLNGNSQTQKFAVVALGTTNANAAALSVGYNVVTGGDATKGVILPAARDGLVVEVKNNSAAVLKVYPPALAAINALTVTTGALSVAANCTVKFVYDGVLQVWSNPLVPS